VKIPWCFYFLQKNKNDFNLFFLANHHIIKACLETDNGYCFLIQIVVTNKNAEKSAHRKE